MSSYLVLPAFDQLGHAPALVLQLFHLITWNTLMQHWEIALSCFVQILWLIFKGLGVHVESSFKDNKSCSYYGHCIVHNYTLSSLSSLFVHQGSLFSLSLVLFEVIYLFIYLFDFIGQQDFEGLRAYVDSLSRIMKVAGLQLLSYVNNSY